MGVVVLPVLGAVDDVGVVDEVVVDAMVMGEEESNERGMPNAIPAAAAAAPPPAPPPPAPPLTSVLRSGAVRTAKECSVTAADAGAKDAAAAAAVFVSLSVGVGVAAAAAAARTLARLAT